MKKNKKEEFSDWGYLLDMDVIEICSAILGGADDEVLSLITDNRLYITDLIYEPEDDFLPRVIIHFNDINGEYSAWESEELNPVYSIDYYNFIRNFMLPYIREQKLQQLI